MHSDVAISVKNLTKTYRIFGHPGDRIKQFLSAGMGQYHREFTAIKDVSFEIKKGETVGIIGRNGSGKSTLLQLICGILKPTSGTVEVNGRISALLELGAGFNPEFTGRENIYFQGAVLGIPRQEMDQRFEDIAAFADIGDFIDQSVRIYSSGMFLRLAFAVAVHVQPEILIVDEALAVGDSGFRARCFRRIGELRSQGCTILFVSHDMDQIIRFCSHAILVDDGEALLAGDPDPVVKQYQRLLASTACDRESIRHVLRVAKSASEHISAATAPSAGLSNKSTFVAETYDPGLHSEPPRPYAPNGALIESVRILNVTGQRVNHLQSGTAYRCVYRVLFERDATLVRFAILITTSGLVDLGGAYSASAPSDGVPEVHAGTEAEVEFAFNCTLNPGTYSLGVSAFASLASIEYALHGIVAAEVFRVVAGPKCLGISSVDFGCQSSIRLAPGTRQ